MSVDVSFNLWLSQNRKNTKYKNTLAYINYDFSWWIFFRNPRK